ncbi:MAG TPA: protein kinase [Oculatellaceae cyanobacterium]
MARVLLIEDDVQLTMMFKLLLEAEKFTVEVCHNGIEAQKAMAINTYDAVVLDWDLPDLSSPAVCRLYRQHGGQAPVVLLTSNISALNDAMVVEIGASERIAKPFDPRELINRLHAFARNGGRMPEAGRRTSGQSTPLHPEIAVALHLLGNRYGDIEQIGYGAMGIVFKATDKTLDRTVALKLLNPDFLPNVQSQARFRAEAQNIARLTHPNIVTIYDFGISSNSVPYLVMEYLNGSSLHEVLYRERQIHPKQAMKIFKQVCDSLVHAHGKGVIHRDIKPGNMMFQQIDPSTYAIKLLDFGISKWLRQGANENYSTKGGEIFGSPLYMSPEQSLGLPVDHRSDIFSIGYIFYECLTGIKLFLGDNDLDTMHKRTVEKPLPFSVVRPDLNLPTPLEAVILKALSLQPQDRYQSAAELRWALDSVSGAAGSVLA